MSEAAVQQYRNRLCFLQTGHFGIPSALKMSLVHHARCRLLLIMLTRHMRDTALHLKRDSQPQKVGVLISEGALFTTL